MSVMDSIEEKYEDQIAVLKAGHLAAMEEKEKSHTAEIQTMNLHIDEILGVVTELKSCLNLFGEDPCWSQILVEKCAEITKLEKQIAAPRKTIDKMDKDVGDLLEQRNKQAALTKTEVKDG